MIWTPKAGSLGFRVMFLLGFSMVMRLLFYCWVFLGYKAFLGFSMFFLVMFSC